jgi:hypothetical protein
MDKRIIIIGLLVSILLVSGCAKQISEVKNEKYLDKEVTVKGTVQGSIKLGTLSGYTLKDDTGEIFVSSKTLPEDGTTKTASGTLKKLPILNTYYIEAK